MIKNKIYINLHIYTSWQYAVYYLKFMLIQNDILYKIFCIKLMRTGVKKELSLNRGEKL